MLPFAHAAGPPAMPRPIQPPYYSRPRPPAQKLRKRGRAATGGRRAARSEGAQHPTGASGKERGGAASGRGEPQPPASHPNRPRPIPHNRQFGAEKIVNLPIVRDWGGEDQVAGWRRGVGSAGCGLGVGAKGLAVPAAGALRAMPPLLGRKSCIPSRLERFSARTCPVCTIGPAKSGPAQDDSLVILYGQDAHALHGTQIPRSRPYRGWRR